MGYSISIHSLLAGNGLAQVVPGLQQSEFRVDLTSSGLVEIEYLPNPQGSTGHIDLHFAQSKGAYHNGFKLNQSSLGTACLLYGSAHPNPGTGMATNAELDCIFFSEECAIECGGAQDPNGYPTDVSCYCMKTSGPWEAPERVALPTSTGGLNPGASVSFVGGLVSDKDRDGQIDQRMSTVPNVADNPTQQSRFTQLEAGVARLDWEDIIQAPSGDFNDFSVLFEARTCEAIPESLEGEEIGTFQDCRDECLNPSAICDQNNDLVVLDPSSVGTPELIFSVSATIDRYQGGDVDREPRGRLMHVTVGSYLNPGSTVHGLGRGMAICPTIAFDLGPFGQSAPLYATGYNVADPAGSNPTQCTPMSTGGEPLCTPRSPSSEMRLSLARDQFYEAGCGMTRVGPGDGFVLRPTPEQDACGDIDGYVSHFEVYEVSLNELHDEMVAAGVTLPRPINEMTVAEIRDLISFIDLSAITGVDVSTPFYCPSGLGHRVTTVGIALFNLQTTNVSKSTSAMGDGFNILARD